MPNEFVCGVSMVTANTQRWDQYGDSKHTNCWRTQWNWVLNEMLIVPQLIKKPSPTPILCNPKVHNRIHTSTPPVRFLSQINPVHAATPFYSSPSPLLPRSSPSFGFPHQNPACIYLFSYTYHVARLSYFPWPAHSNNIRWGTQLIKLLMMQFFSITLQLLLGPMYLPQHTFFPQCGAANFIPSQSARGGGVLY